MVRLSLVNLYLHGFSEPSIDEYDSLSYDDKWNEVADVFFANPPFFSPKGCIKPHNRFSIKSKRAEVLFTDYIAQHLTPKGRAGVIVPEGVIFQNQNAYKQLRKMLVEDYLVAVISLPTGVFNPYAGVKTSILIMDKSLAKQSNTIGFFKVDNDGFELGAQRRKIDKNDLPQVHKEITEYLEKLQSRESVENFKPTIGLIAPKEKVAENGEYNLNGERYKKDERYSELKHQVFKLEELCLFMTGGTPTSTKNKYYDGGTVPWLVSGDIHQNEIWGCEKRITEMGVENSNAKTLPQDSVLIALNGQGKTRGTVALLRMNGATCNQSLVSILPIKKEKLMVEFLFFSLRSMYKQIRGLTGDSQRSGLNIPILKEIKIPLPPLEIQKEIVAEIEGYQKVIDGARAVVDNYRPQIAVDPEWPIVKLGDVCALGGSITKEVDLSLPYFGADSIESNTGKLLKTQTSVSIEFYDFMKLQEIRRGPRSGRGGRRFKSSHPDD